MIANSFPIKNFVNLWHNFKQKSDVSRRNGKTNAG